MAHCNNKRAVTARFQESMSYRNMLITRYFMGC
jgi:hypothetical protein